MVKYKVSVIIPIYNAQDTIQRCIDSVINQTIGFSNIELILYDDNSTDDTRKILQEYSKKYDNIVLILSNENSGFAGKGRNEGIKRATADYIMFIDSDDEYKEDICETLYNEIIKEDADIGSCNFENRDEISSNVAYNAYRFGINNNGKITFLNDDVFNYIDIMIWDKIYRKSTIIDNDVKFPEKGISEDTYFNFILLIFSKKIIYLKDYTGYIWHVQSDSLSHTQNPERIIKSIDVFLKIYSYYKNNEINADMSWLFHQRISSELSIIMASPFDDEQVNDLLNSIYLFEQEIGFNDSYLPFISKIPNKLIMKRKFKLAIFYFKIIGFLFQSSKLRKVYRAIVN